MEIDPKALHCNLKTERAISFLQLFPDKAPWRKTALFSGAGRLAQYMISTGHPDFVAQTGDPTVLIRRPRVLFHDEISDLKN
jgi:hypothetical protein